MRGRDLKRNVYEKLVSLNYSRKENYLYDANEIEWNELNGEIKDTILSFPTRHIDWFVDLMDIEDLDGGGQQFYLFHSEGKTFLVDTQGYNYPRYIVQLVGFDELGFEERMDGLVRMADVLVFEIVVNSLASELKRDGFDKEDIVEYLQAKVKKLVV